LLDEGLRTERHPLIYFRQGGSGLRRPALIGTRLDVWQIIDTLRAEGNDVAATASYFGIDEAQVRVCISYYAEFKEEIDSYAAAEHEFVRRAYKRWQQEQTVLE
jgi:uncharacterized protein (DUF433 family)